MRRCNRLLWTLVGLLLVALGGYGVTMHLGLWDGRLGPLRRDSALLAAPITDSWRGAGRWPWVAVAVAGLVLTVLGYGLLAARLRRRGGPIRQVSYRPVHAAGEPETVAPDQVTPEAPPPGGPPHEDPAPSELVRERVTAGSPAVIEAEPLVAEESSVDGPAYRPSERWEELDQAMPGRHRATAMPAAELLTPGAHAAHRPGTARVPAATLAHGVEQDLTRHPEIQRASVRLYGSAERPALRATLEVTGGADLDDVAPAVAGSVARLSRTSGRTVSGVEVVVRLCGGPPVTNG